MHEFPEAPDCISDLPLPMGVRIPPLLTLQYFAEAAQAWTIEARRASGGHAAAMERKAVMVATYVMFTCSMTWHGTWRDSAGKEAARARATLERRATRKEQARVARRGRHRHRATHARVDDDE